jgi:hypothetical protein
MKTNIGWIKLDYWVQTILGCCIVAFAVSVVGLFVALIFLIPFGAWQVISGLVSALRGDRIQQIYLSVVTIHLSLWFGSYTMDVGAFLIIPLILVAIIIGIWKYTVIRADYISLDIIDVPNTDTDNLLDA